MRIEAYDSSYTDIVDIVKEVRPLGQDILNSLLGRKLGYGVYRSVFDHQLNPKHVIKLEPAAPFCNPTEYLIWQNVFWLQGDLKIRVKDWFAPVHWISPGGHVLCMSKTEPRPAKRRPAKIPSFLWDVKQENFGWIGNNFVCHDYGNIDSLVHYSKTFKDASYAWTNDPKI